jgi:hypothetical protein
MKPAREQRTGFAGPTASLRYWQGAENFFIERLSVRSEAPTAAFQDDCQILRLRLR